MSSLKFKYTLPQANERLKTLTLETFPQSDRLNYQLLTGLGASTLYKYLRGECPSIVAANHLATYIDNLREKVPA